MKLRWIRRKLREDAVPELGERRVLCNWVRDEDSNTLVDMARYSRLLPLLPDRVVESLEKARAERAGVGPMLTAGLGYEELLSSVIVDGTLVGNSSTEAFLFPALKFPANYLQPGGIPGRTLRWTARGRNTTLTTASTLTFKFGAALTNVIPTTTWAVSGALTSHATAQTATQWKCKGEVVVRTVGSAGTVFAQGDAFTAISDLTTATQQSFFMGSAGAATPSTATVDMTVDQYVSLTAKWSLTTAYTITGHTFVVESLN